MTSPFLNRLISSEARPQYFLTSGRCFFRRAIAASNCFFVSSYGSLIPSDGCRLREVQRRVRDLDRVVRHGDLALELRAVEHRDAGRGRLHLRRVVEQRVRAPLQRDPVVLALHRVVRRALEALEELLEARHLRRVHRRDVAAVDQPEARVARGRDHVVLAAAAGAHQRDHLVRRAGVLRIDLAAGRLLERLHPRRGRGSPPTRSCSACLRSRSPSSWPPSGRRARPPRAPARRSAT